MSFFTNKITSIIGQFMDIKHVLFIQCILKVMVQVFKLSCFVTINATNMNETQNERAPSKLNFVLIIAT